MEGISNFESNPIKQSTESLSEYAKENRNLIIEEAEVLREQQEAKRHAKDIEEKNKLDSLLKAFSKYKEEAKNNPDAVIDDGKERSLPFWKIQEEGYEDESFGTVKRYISRWSEDLSNLATVYAYTGETGRAVEIIEALEADNSSEDNLNFEKAIASTATVLIDKGDLDTAEQLLNRIPSSRYTKLQEWSNNSPTIAAAYSLIRNLIQGGNKEKAIFFADSHGNKKDVFPVVCRELVAQNDIQAAQDIIFQLDGENKVSASIETAKTLSECGYKEEAEKLIDATEKEIGKISFPPETQQWEISRKLQGYKTALSRIKGGSTEFAESEIIKEIDYFDQATESIKNGNIEEAASFYEKAPGQIWDREKQKKTEELIKKGLSAEDIEKYRLAVPSGGLNISLREKAIEAGYQIASAYGRAGNKEKEREYLNSVFYRYAYNRPENFLKKIWESGNKILVHKFLRSKYRKLFQTIDSQGHILPYAGMARNTRSYSDVVSRHNEDSNELFRMQLAIGDFEGAEKTNKYCFYERRTNDLARQEAISSYNKLKELKEKNVDSIDVLKVLRGAVNTNDNKLIESLGVVMTEEERNTALGGGEYSQDVINKLILNRGLSGNVGEDEYGHLLEQAKELLSNYVHNEEENKPAVKKIIEVLDNLAPEEAGEFIAREISTVDAANPHAVRLLKYLLDTESPQAEKIALNLLRQKNLPEAHFSYIAEKLLGESIHEWSDDLTGVRPPEEKIITKVKSIDPVLHSYLAKRLLTNKIVRPFFKEDRSDYAQTNAKEIIILHINDFKELNSEVAQELEGFQFYHRGSQITFNVNDYLRSFKDLDTDTALNIIKKGRAGQVLEDISSFAPFDETKFGQFFDEQVQNKNWKVVAELSQFDVCKEKFTKLFEEYKKFAEDTSEHFSLRRDAIDFLASLAREGAVSIEEEFIDIIQNRAKQKEAPEGKWSLDPAQEAAFYALMRLDNQRVNQALFKMLLNDNVPGTVKKAVTRKLLTPTRDFADGNVKSTIETWYKTKKADQIEWKDLLFINAIGSDIPSTELREKSLASLGATDLLNTFNRGNLYDIWQKNYKNIPENTFLQLRNLISKVNPEGQGFLLFKFQNLYKSIAKENSKKDSLLYGIVNCLDADKRLSEALMNKMSELEFGSKPDVELISKIFKQVAFLDNLSNSIGRNYSRYDDDYYQEDDFDQYYVPEQVPPEGLMSGEPQVAPKEKEKIEEKETEKDKLVKEVASAIENIQSLSALNNSLDELISVKIREILPNEEITSEKLQALNERWGDLEPIFTYVGRYPHLKEFVAEVVVHTDSTENWKKWRYDRDEYTVEKQLKMLSPEQLGVWARDYNIELGDLDLNENESTKPKEIRDILTQAVVEFKHIYNPEESKRGSQFIQDNIENVFKRISENPAMVENILESEIKSTEELVDDLNTLIQARSTTQYRQILESAFSEGAEVSVSSKTKNLLGLISGILSPELKKAVNKNYQKIADEDNKQFDINKCLTPEVRAYLSNRIEEIENKSGDLKSSSELMSKLGLDQNAELKNLYIRRNDLSAAINLMRLANLNNRLIATNQIHEQETKSGESLSSALKNLQKQFENTAFELDLKNIESKLHQRSELHQKRKIAMVFTDDPQMLWQVGKYPLGNGSCQHYAEGGYADKLMGYVGDANCKVAYMVDINSLPNELKEKADKGVPISEIIDTASKNDLLVASVARVMIKMGKNDQNKPAIIIEPTYTKINKGDESMDRYFDLFIKNFVASEMGANIYRSHGPEKVSLGESRSPGGQYEDLQLSSLKIIN